MPSLHDPQVWLIKKIKKHIYELLKYAATVKTLEFDKKIQINNKTNMSNRIMTKLPRNTEYVELVDIVPQPIMRNNTQKVNHTHTPEQKGHLKQDCP